MFGYQGRYLRGDLTTGLSDYVPLPEDVLRRVSIRSASEVWGLPPAQTEERLRAELGPQFQTAAIGPAGERLVRYATISHDARHAGRGGLGAVMGSKRLKAVAVAGSQRALL